MSKRSLGSIKTIAVVDLETNCLPGYAGDRTCAITELSLYAFSATNFRGVDIYEKVGIANLGLRKPPVLPRALHKITMMINPGRPMSPEAANITGLTNAMLVDEATFDRNAANCLLTFLERLEKPICLLAHNGSKFDFPVMRYVFRRLDMTIPSTIYCMDTFTVFREIDEKQTLIKRMKEKLLEVEKSSSSGECKTEMEKRLNDLAMYRTLFLHKFRPTPRYPRKGTYVLGNIFKRVFGQPAEHLHRAEADVEILTKIILHYGLPFLACVEERKQSFGEVTDLRPLI